MTPARARSTWVRSCVPRPRPPRPREHRCRLQCPTTRRRIRTGSTRRVTPSNGCRFWETLASRPRDTTRRTLRPCGSSRPTARPCSAPMVRCPPSRHPRSSAIRMPNRAPTRRYREATAVERAVTTHQEGVPAARAARRPLQDPAMVVLATADQTTVGIVPGRRTSRPRPPRGRWWHRPFRAALATVSRPEVAGEPVSQGFLPPQQGSAERRSTGPGSVPAGSSAHAARVCRAHWDAAGSPQQSARRASPGPAGPSRVWRSRSGAQPWGRWRVPPDGRWRAGPGPGGHRAPAPQLPGRDRGHLG